MRRLVILIAVVSMLIPGLRAEAETTSPSSPLTMPRMPLHDPFILAYAPTRTYYLYTKNRVEMTGVKTMGTMVYKSKDLEHWERPEVVFTIPPGAVAQEGAWAPEVHEYKGRFYLFTTLHNTARTIAAPPKVLFRTYMRGTYVAVSDSPDGPFKMLNERAPLPPANFMTLDGTLYFDKSGKPWLVYAHEWIQKLDGTMEAIPLRGDLARASGKPIHLFQGSDAPWYNSTITPDTKGMTYVTDGPEVYRTRDGHLLMLWSSYERGSYVEACARSRSGEIQGPWEQLTPLVKGDSGHGMLFHTFDGQLMLVIHHPFKHARGKLYEMRDDGDHLTVLRERRDLDGG
jgi:beta-xylosidase